MKVLSNGSTQGSSTAGALRLETSFKYVDIGCKYSNGAHTHFYTNADAGYWFDKEVMLGTGKLKTFSTDLRFYIANDQVMMIRNGYYNVGIGYGYTPSTSFRLDVNGNMRITGNLTQDSDLRLKKDIKDLEKNKVSKLYDLKAKTYLKEKKPRPEVNIAPSDSAYIPVPEEPEDTTTHIGFIAQELQADFPELVKEDDEGYLSINYIALIPVLVEALKEQNTRIIQLEENLKKDTEDDKFKSATIDPNTQASLSQNQPNPFNEETIIEYFLPATTTKATMYIYNLQGKQLKSIAMNQYGSGQVHIFGSELQPGIYYYSLVADGKIIGTEQMILTK